MQLTDVTVQLRSSMGGDDLGSVAVGLGDPNPEDSRHAVVLNSKGYRGANFYSVSQLVASDRMLSEWKRRIATSADIKRIVIEDYSIDTCFALLLFSARLEDRKVSEHPRFDEAAWEAYVTAWEQGKFVDAAVEISPACLLTSLAHALLPINGSDAKSGLTTCLQFLQEMLDSCPNPSSGIPSTFASARYRDAIAQMEFDRQQYGAALQRGK